jgi:hypothetical protein
MHISLSPHSPTHSPTCSHFKGIHGRVEVGNVALFDNVSVVYTCAAQPSNEEASTEAPPSEEETSTEAPPSEEEESTEVGETSTGAPPQEEEESTEAGEMSTEASPRTEEEVEPAQCDVNTNAALDGGAELAAEGGSDWTGSPSNVAITTAHPSGSGGAVFLVDPSSSSSAPYRISQTVAVPVAAESVTISVEVHNSVANTGITGHAAVAAEFVGGVASPSR